MILESIKSFEKLRNFHPGFDKIHDFIKNNDLCSLPVGAFDIDGRIIYGEVFQMGTEGIEKLPLEVHDAHIEAYIVLKGNAIVGYCDRVICDDNNASYDANEDVAYIDSDPEVFLVIAPGNMIICFPQDAHNLIVAEDIIKYIRFRIKI